ncbi:MAG: hydrogenase expression/formation protein HypE [Pirellulales bacterium]|nr:hydrogenase expression/formation protein HypE [Pirellulales bacterium]
MSDDLNLHCPLPLRDHPAVQMAHGGGGRMMRQLIESLFLPAFSTPPSAFRLPPSFPNALAVGSRLNELLSPLPSPLSPASPPHDSAILEIGGQKLAFTTDTFVVSPLFFPGGDIGKLAVFGTVNDLAMAGAKPLYLSAGFVLEEGLPMDVLQRIVASMAAAAAECGVKIVTGDTKVVDRGKGDGIFINTAGVGLVPEGIEILPRRVAPGDAILVSGDLGRHGMAVMSVREGLGFEGDIQSDCANLAGLVESLLDLGVNLHCLRDLTRGGLAAALNEIALDMNLGMELDEWKIPVTEPVVAACEILGLDPLYVANEGRLVAFVAAEVADEALAIMAEHPTAVGPAIVGRVAKEPAGTVVLTNPFGGGRIVDLLSGEQLPRIC